jgi:hypothetical protein
MGNQRLWPGISKKWDTVAVALQSGGLDMTARSALIVRSANGLYRPFGLSLTASAQGDLEKAIGPANTCWWAILYSNERPQSS